MLVMALQTSVAQKTQIYEELERRYFALIPALQARGWTDEQHKKNRLSRSLAAFAIEKLANVTPAQAANSVTDGGDDNGIDAIYFDRAGNTLYVVQSKIGDAPSMIENKAFCDGIRDIIRVRFDRFNANFARLQPDIEEALETDGVQIVACNVHLGDNLGPHVVRDLEELKVDLNRFIFRFAWLDGNRLKVHEWLTSEHEIRSPRVTLVIENWYGLEVPRKAFYGLVSAEQLAILYVNEGRSIFEKNIRYYLGDQSVNIGISETVGNRPDELFFLNNGITALSTSISMPPGATHERAQFTLEGFSVVNGAQTVGSIAAAHSLNGGIAASAKLLITLIEVADNPNSLGPEITRTRNTQNAVRGLHFAALDPQQERLRQEMAVSGVTYYYRPAESTRRPDENVITIEAAANALACFSGVTRTVVAAKRESGQLYDRNGEYYSTLFTAGLSGVHLCRVVRIFDYLSNILSASESAETDFFRRMFYRHGKPFILHILARRHRRLLDKPEIELSDEDKDELSRIVTELAEFIYDVAESQIHRSKGYLSVFRNNTDAEPLSREVMRLLQERDARNAAAAVAADGNPDPITPPETTPE
jgi:hypothetical protein